MMKRSTIAALILAADQYDRIADIQAIDPCLGRPQPSAVKMLENRAITARRIANDIAQGNGAAPRG
jgi:hypothetical protein